MMEPLQPDKRIVSLIRCHRVHGVRGSLSSFSPKTQGTKSALLTL